MTPHTLVAVLTTIIYTLRGGRGNVNRAVDTAVEIADVVLDRDLSHLTRRPAGAEQDCADCPEPTGPALVDEDEAEGVDWSEGFETIEDDDSEEDS